MKTHSKFLKKNKKLVTNTLLGSCILLAGATQAKTFSHEFYNKCTPPLICQQSQSLSATDCSKSDTDSFFLI